MFSPLSLGERVKVRGKIVILAKAELAPVQTGGWR